MGSETILIWAAFFYLSSGCAVLTEPCDEDQAFSVVFARLGPFAGRPAFAGQALVTSSCGNGTFCHAANARGDLRFGVPEGLDFDVRLACSEVAGCDENAIERLRVNQLHVLGYREEIASRVQSGAMPPGQRGSVALDSAGFRMGADASAPLLPRIGEAGGLAILKNWLSCGAPVVEATAPPTLQNPPGSSCGRGPGEVGECIVRAEVSLPAPTWESIYGLVIAPACGRSCHGPDGVDQRVESALDLSDIDVAYNSLVNVRAAGVECVGEPSLLRLVPGDPDRSLLLQKFLDPPPCGDPMPIRSKLLPGETTDVIRQWIAAGAPR